MIPAITSKPHLLKPPPSCAPAIAAAEKAEADRIAAAAQAEQNRKAAVAAEQKRAAEEMAAAAAKEVKRTANKAHRSRVMGEAKDALIAHAEINEDAARRVVIAISKGLVSNVVMGF
jgi:regulator of protease activity HflC (stomatin/prohibitin superfamily)